MQIFREEGDEMKEKMLIIVTLFFVISLTTLGWTYRVYEMVLNEALESLPNEISEFLRDEDMWKKLVKAMKWNDDLGKPEHLQKPIHYFKSEVYNLDEGNIPLSFSKAKRKMRGDRNRAIANGMLPWVVMRYSKACIDLYSTNPPSFPTAVGLMVHFITDLNSPFHLTRNLNGELTNQKGIHERWEKMMAERLEFLNMGTVKPKQIDDLAYYIFENILKSREYLDRILDEDVSAKEQALGYTDEYYDIMFEKTKDIAERLLQNSIQMVADVLYTAYMKKQSGKLPELNITMIKLYHWGDDRYVILQNRGKKGINLRGWKLKAYDYDRGCLLNYFEFLNLILSPREKVSIHSGPRTRTTRASDQFWTLERVWGEHSEAVLIDRKGTYMDIYVY